MHYAQMAILFSSAAGAIIKVEPLCVIQAAYGIKYTHALGPSLGPKNS